VRLRFGIPLTILLLAATSYGSGMLPFNAYYALVAATAIWAAYDSHRLRVQRFDSSLALPPIGILAALVVLWPFTFPAYLKLRYRVQHGEAESPVSRSSRLGWWVLGGAAIVVVTASVVLWRSPTIQGLRSLATDIAEEFGLRTQMNVSLTGRNLSVTIYNPPSLSDSMRVQWAESIARFASDRYAPAGALDSVSVRLADQREQGAITTTRERQRYSWAVEQLRSSEPPRNDDIFARSFLENVRMQNKAGASQLQPGSTISSRGWERIAASSSYFPTDTPQRVRPVRWELLVNSAGIARKISYSIETSTDTALADVLLVDASGRTYVNTFRIMAPKKR
jgi:hypothetical protein